MQGPASELPAEPAKASELRLRVLSGVAMVAVALGATWAGGAVFGMLWLAASLVIAHEWDTMAGAEPRRPLVAVTGAGLLALSVALFAGAGATVLLATFTVATAVLALLARSLPSRLWAVAGFAYATVVALVPAAVREDPNLGIAAILWMFAVVWTTDIVAYFTGRRLGGPKLWPSVSPKKTWSGFLGGLIGAVLAGVAVAALASRNGASVTSNLAVVAVASAVASVASQLGDLAESAMKRRFGAKDSGRLIPGHGGVMDRLDGFVAVALLVGLALAGTRLAR